MILAANLYVLILLFLILLFVLWCLLPFALFGIKPLLRELIQVQRETNALLRPASEPTARPASEPTARPASEPSLRVDQARLTYWRNPPPY